MNWVDIVFGKIDKVIDILSKAAVAISALSLVFLVFMITAYVFVREFLYGQWLFVEEWSGYLLVLIFYWACAYALRSGAHIKVDIVFRLFPDRVKPWVECVSALMATSILGFLIKGSIDWVIYAVEERVVSDYPSLTPMWIPLAFVPIGLGHFGLAMGLETVRRVTVAVAGDHNKR
jgi:TRAP-type C4-dicarboxylate transport system permease small subunit